MATARSGKGRRRVVVVGMDDGPEGGPGPAVLACVDPARHERVAVALGPWESGAYRPGVADRIERVAAPEEDEAGFRRGLLSLVLCGETVFLPGSHGSVAPLARAAPDLAAAGAQVPLPSSESLLSLEPAALFRFCDQHAIATVRWAAASEDGSFPDAPADFRYPAVVHDDALARSSVLDPAHAAEVARSGLRREGSAPATLVEAQGTDAYEVALAADRRGRIAGLGAARILADDDRGRPWLAVTVDNPEIAALAARVATGLAIRGPLVVTISGEGGGRVAFARAGFPIWIEALASAGVNLVERLLGGRPAANGARGLGAAPGMLFSQTAEDLVVLAGAPAGMIRPNVR